MEEEEEGGGGGGVQSKNKNNRTKALKKLTLTSLLTLQCSKPFKT